MTDFHIQDGVLLEADQLPSPNFNQRPDGSAGVVSGIVIHNISLPPDQFAQHNAQGVHHVKAFFQNNLNKDDHPYFATIAQMQVSAHLLIERDGRVTQFVNFNDRAWHAGASSYLGRSNCNDFTIGIELEGSDYRPFEAVQYQVLSKIIAAIYQAYPKTRHHLMGHSDIAPVRKTDPGEFFDWWQLRHLLDQAIKNQA